MTAEIAIMNKEAVALASDSAVTSNVGQGPKIFTSANKLFALSKYHPVGIMVYGNASLMHVPWEIVIKEYRKHLGDKTFSRLEEYADDFVKFIETQDLLFPLSIQEQFYEIMVRAYYEVINNEIKKEIELVIKRNGSIPERNIRQIANQVISKHSLNLQTAPSSPSSHTTRTIVRRFVTIINRAFNVFDRLPISKQNASRLRTIAGDISAKFPSMQYGGNSGVVIAGFGTEDYFPALRSLSVEIIIANKLKYRIEKETRIDATKTAAIIPFAQQELVATFMEGIDPQLKSTEESYLSEVFKKCIERVSNEVSGLSGVQKANLLQKLNDITTEEINNHRSKLQTFCKKKYVNPVMTVVSMLPKDELAAMAEVFVNLTSFKRRVSTEFETVGGPIDVAVISKGDGLIWIKRKHYFRPELNPQFFVNYNK